MPAPLTIVLNISWGAFILVWLVGAFRVKRDIGEGQWFERVPTFLPRLLCAAVLLVLLRLLGTSAGVPLRGSVLFKPGPLLASGSAACTIVGIGIAIWARLHLGSNWSQRPARKIGHALVTSGPYRRVRHPIYGGMLLAVIGIVLTGNFAGPVALVVAIAVYARRIVHEEQIMLALFPAEYPAYRQRTWRLIPFVW